MSKVYSEMKYSILSVTLISNMGLLISSNVKAIKRPTDVCDLKESCAFLFLSLRDTNFHGISII
jgi:hypothetical protein